MEGSIRRREKRRRETLTGVAAALLGLVAAGPARSENYPARGESYVRLEAEAYYEPTGDQGCGPPIQRHQCDAASGGWGVDGVNCAAEWIPLELVPPSYAFQIGTRSAASVGFVRTFQIRVLNVDDNYAEVVADTLVTQPGLGFS